ncbi:26S proteasome non ATPase regulatory subunit 10 [Trichuris trichiura]|uniref:26S proteasome non ATPase regulatory subunit 10 n=1 Tax=Trichuris trichiura TaxID=36087 RepID=A0A077Z3D6_TRITR|nr:26S proteasome non ATPase regulatory subunit 10 [Trichuris trichiura]
MKATLNFPVLLRAVFIASAAFSAKTEGCTSHNSCVGQSLCVSGDCLPCEPTGAYCEQDKNCHQREACKYGICMKVSGRPDIECFNSNNCVGQTLCVYGKCRLATPTEGDCNTDKDCKQNDSCKFGICMKPIGGECKRHEDCSGPKLCRSYGYCEAGRRVSSQCSYDSTCGDQGACKYGYCWKFESYFKKRCNKQDDCADTLICDRGICVEGEPTDKECKENSECKRSGACKKNICWIVAMNRPTKAEG